MEIKIVDCVELNERKDLRKKQSEQRKGGREGEDKREETERKQRETGRGVTAFSQLARSFPSVYVTSAASKSGHIPHWHIPHSHIPHQVRP